MGINVVAKLVKRIAIKLKSLISVSHVWQKKREPLLFVHIPKTAGSSLKSSLADHFKLIFDYGKKSNVTHPMVVKHIFQQNDFFSFTALFSKLCNAVLCGHIKLDKYIDQVNVTNTISFIREPKEQIISHFNHYVTVFDYQGSFDDFLTRQTAKSLQTKYLDYLPLSLMGYVGITEQYNESLIIINQQYNLALQPKQRNINKHKIVTAQNMSAAQLALLTQNNQQDIALYKEACWLHAQRYALLKQNKPWVYGLVKCVKKNRHIMLLGCAYSAQELEPITLEIKKNHQLFKSIVANEYFTEYEKAKFPRGRYVGFSVVLPKNITADDSFGVYVKGTGQQLNYQPLSI